MVTSRWDSPRASQIRRNACWALQDEITHGRVLAPCRPVVGVEWRWNESDLARWKGVGRTFLQSQQWGQSFRGRKTQSKFRENQEICLTGTKNFHLGRQIGWKCKVGQAVDSAEISHSFVQGGWYTKATYYIAYSCLFHQVMNLNWRESLKNASKTLQHSGWGDRGWVCEVQD